jgi:FAD/FMN-containing dehydrogenase/Fe-S oxidoreductase
VVRPRTADAAVAAVGVAADLGVPITSRGAGTSIAGNACGEGVVLDFARHLNAVLDVDPGSRTARVQPGVVPDVLNATARRHGLHFAPDPSTHSRCTIGGMIGNNACGAHSVAWGMTADNVEALDVLLPDGTRFDAGPVTTDRLPVHRSLRTLRDDVMAAVRTGFPRIPRRVSGYNLDQLLPENGFHVGRALVGSEGTCVTVLGATVRLVEIPARRALVVLGFEDTYAAADQVVALLSLDVLAVEGVNEDIVSILRQRKPGTPGLKALPAGRSWLFVETADPDAVVAAMPGAVGSVVVADPGQMRELWRIREDGAGLATRMPDGAEAWSGWEDAAVPPERLGAYLRDFDRLLGRHGRRGPTYGHYGDGCLHVRIDFDLNGPGYRKFLEEAADLVVSHGGSLSGEHGDGQARSELLPRMYSPEIMAAFGRFKAIFDPRGLMNPGRIVDPLPLDADLRVVVAPARIPLRTKLALHADDGDLAAATRRCVGVAKCLNTSGGVMCPSYRVTREEKHSTRGRARLLFDMLNGSVVRGGFRSTEVREALDLCLSCKGCKRDCPVDVDMATYKAEFLHQHYRGRPRPMSHYSMGFLPLWLAIAPGLVRALGDRRVVKRLGGIDPRRSMPIVHDRSFRSRFRPRAGSGDPVVLFVDTFTDHFDPRVGLDAVTVLEHLGFQVSLPRKRVCCGLTWMSTGQLGVARRVLRRTARIMDGSDTPVVGLEPSCTAFLKADALELADDPAVRRLAARVRTFAQQVAPVMTSLGEAEAVMQPHCHQYAELGVDADKEVLRTAGVDTRVLDAGCCGLAGNFGFEAGHYDVSVAVAEHALLPAVRATDATVLADGFSCRTQLRQLTDRDPVHLATLLATLINSRPEAVNGPFLNSE